MTAAVKIDALRLRVMTERGEMGRELRFRTGLNLLRADNTSGKSTALQGIIYALGLEGMLSPSQRVPLPHAMTDSLVVDGEYAKVINSRVELEFSGVLGTVITVARSVVSATVDRRLITVTHGPNITKPAEYRTVDYFVRRQGAAQNEAGFHRFLAEFLGLDLPTVGRVDGSEGPLYLETLFPYFFVEQKHGWSGIQARIPTYLGIRDVSRRSAEFVLGLEAFDRVLRRQRIKSNMAMLESEWQDLNRRAGELAKLSQVVIMRPAGRISQGLPTGMFVPSVSINDRWLPLGEAVDHVRSDLERSQGPVRSAGEAAGGTEQRLALLDVSLRQALAVSASLGEEHSELDRRHVQVELRLEALREDLQRQKDTQVLNVYGAQHAHALVSDHVCPTCHQEFGDGADISPHTMTVSENIDFINRQVQTFERTREDIERVLGAVSVRESSLVAQIREFRADIRSSRESLTSASSAPSVADVARRLTLEARSIELGLREQEFAGLRESLVSSCDQWSAQSRGLTALGKDDLSSADRSKLAALETSIRGQLAAYGFKSLNPSEIDVDPGSYRPTHEGFDLGFDLSASDMIRVIWAYLFAMLNVSREKGGNHLGLLIFDEPRQQETARESYRQLLAHAAASATAGKQIIFATSEPSDSLKSLLGDNAYNLLDLAPGEKLLRVWS